MINGFALYMDNIYMSHEMSNVPSGETRNASDPLVADLGQVKDVDSETYVVSTFGCLL